jgi:hypothetical protein
MNPKFILFLALVSSGGLLKSHADTNHWQSGVLWSNKVLSAKMLFLPKASVADEDCMALEFENNSSNVLDIAQAFLNVDGVWTDLATGKVVSSGGITGGVAYTGKLFPGITTVTGYIFKAASANLGLPPKEGFHVDAVAIGDTRLNDGQVFATPKKGARFSFEWVCPTPMEVESVKPRFKELLNHPDNQFASGYRLDALVKVQELGDSASLDELLSALKSHSWVDGKDAVMTIVGRRFPDDPKVISYFVEQLSRRDGDAFFSFPREIWSNPVFVKPLVVRYEKYGNDSMELQALRADWVTNRQIIARLSTALFKHHPVLTRSVGDLSDSNLCEWCSAVSEAGMIGDTNFLRWLKPALDDKRSPGCISKYDSRPRLPWNPRVCDYAVTAVLMITDSDSWSAFKKLGIEGWRTREENYSAHDRVIQGLKKRLQSLNSPSNK